MQEHTTINQDKQTNTANDCPLCGTPLPDGGVSWEPHAKSDAQRHLGKCIRQNVHGNLKAAFDLLIDGDDGLENLFGAASAKPEGLFAVLHKFRGTVDDFLAGRRLEQFPEPNAHVWVARHTGFQSLIVEYPAQGEGAAQYTLAVRIETEGDEKAYRVGSLGLAGDGFDH